MKKKLDSLVILENDYQVVDWYVEPSRGCGSTVSDIRIFEGMNELQDYRESGVYRMADVPFEIRKIDPHRYEEKEPYIAFAKDYSDKVCESIKAGSAFLATGSYCTHIPSILGGIRRAAGTGKRIGVVWLDAHADNYIVEETGAEKLRLLGVPMSTFLGQTYPQWREEAGLIPPIAGEDTLAGDLRQCDDESRKYLERAHVRTTGPEGFCQTETWKQAVRDLADRVDAIFMHVDADILSPEYLPAYEYKVEGGNPLETVKENIAAVAQTGKLIGATVMCIGFENKPDRHRDVNNMNGIRLVSAVLRNWKEMPDINGSKEE
ncbi:MAG: arginase family protein [Emergencia sp.]